MPRGREPGHVGAGLGDDHVGGDGTDPGDGADQVPESLKGLDHHLDPVGELLDRRRVLVDQVQVHPGQERVVLGEPAGQRLGQLRDLRPQPSLGQIREHGRVALSRRSAPRASPARRHPMMSEATADSLIPASSSSFSSRWTSRPRSRVIAVRARVRSRSCADRLGRHERAADQPVRAELGQPGRVRDIGLAAGQVLHVPGVDQHAPRSRRPRAGSRTASSSRRSPPSPHR